MKIALSPAPSPAHGLGCMLHGCFLGPRSSVLPTRRLAIGKWRCNSEVGRMRQRCPSHGMPTGNLAHGVSLGARSNWRNSPTMTALFASPRRFTIQDNQFEMQFAGRFEELRIVGKFTTDRGEFAVTGKPAEPGKIRSGQRRPDPLEHGWLSAQVGEDCVDRCQVRAVLRHPDCGWQGGIHRPRRRAGHKSRHQRVVVSGGFLPAHNAGRVSFGGGWRGGFRRTSRSPMISTTNHSDWRRAPCTCGAAARPCGASIRGIVSPMRPAIPKTLCSTTPVANTIDLTGRAAGTMRVTITSTS